MIPKVVRSGTGASALKENRRVLVRRPGCSATESSPVPKWNWVSLSHWMNIKTKKSREVLRANTHTRAHAQKHSLVPLTCISVNYFTGHTELHSEAEQSLVQQQR